MWKSHGRACVTDATIDCCNKHVSSSMLFPCHYFPDKTAFTFLQCSLQSLSHAALAPLFSFPLPLLLFLQSPLQSLISFNPAITLSDFLLTPYISFFRAGNKSCRMLGEHGCGETPKSFFSLKKILVILFNCSLMPLRCQ